MGLKPFNRSSVIYDTPEFFQDTLFVVGDSPVTLDINVALGRNATDVLITNDGAGNFTYAISGDGSVYGDEITLKKNEWKHYTDISINRVRLTWVSDSAYRVEAI